MTNLSPLEKAIISKPLTQELVSNFIENYLQFLQFYDSEGPGPKGSLVITNDKGGREKYIIAINKKYSEEERVTFLHEIIHGVYMQAENESIELNNEQIEYLIERETERFYENNSNFIDNLFGELITSKSVNH